MNWRDVWILYTREVRSALRERTIVVSSILIPVFLYPILLWAGFTALAFVQGLSEGFTSRIVLFNVPETHRELGDSLSELGEVELLLGRDELDAARTRMQDGELDAIVEFYEASSTGSDLPNNFRMVIRYDQTVQRSVIASDRIEGVLADYRTRWMQEAGRGLGISAEDQRPFLVVVENQSTEREMGAVLLGSLVPLLLVFMVAVGCFVPAVDTTAGERERATWETLMSVSASRLSVVTAKYLYVATVGIAAGALNVLAVVLSLGAVLKPLLGDANGSFHFAIPLGAIPIMMLGAVALALLFGAAMMIVAAFARTFKEGQAMVTPAVWVALLPLVLGQQTDRTLSPVIAAVPVANVAMMVRDALNGIFLWPYIVETLLVITVLVIGCLLLARWILGFEDFLLGSHDGSLWNFLRERLFRGGSPERASAQTLGSRP